MEPTESQRGSGRDYQSTKGSTDTQLEVKTLALVNQMMIIIIIIIVKETNRWDRIVNKQRNALLPEIAAWQSSIFKGALLAQLCLSWCATLVPRLEEWFPVEGRFTIDRQGRANCVSIGGDYWAAWKTRVARDIYHTICYTPNVSTCCPPPPTLSNLLHRHSNL